MKYIVLLCAIVLTACHSSQKTGELVGVSKNVSIENYWQLTKLNNKPVTTGYLIFHQQTIKGSLGCGPISGSYRIDGDILQIKPVTSDTICNDKADFEIEFLTAISGANLYKIKGSVLSLKKRESQVAEFQVVRAKTY